MGLKICYIYISAGIKSDSVQKKVIAQINSLNSCGVKCRGAFFTNDVKKETVFNEYISLIPYPISNRKYFNIIFQKRQLIKKVSEYISKTINPSEYIYLRYPGVTFNLFKFVKKNKYMVISEHQSIEIDELRSYKLEHPLGFNLSQIISYILYQFWPIFNEKIWYKPYSKYLKAKVAVTNEIGSFHKKNCRNVWIIPNGIELGDYKIRQAPEFNTVLKILFLKGASSQASWYGLDRLIKSIDLYVSRDQKIELLVCGNIIQGEIPNRDYIIQTGYLNSDELDQLFSSVHIAFSTLCLFRINLEEAAVLKAREYFTRGIPFVYGYNDPDIKEDDPINKYVLKVPNDDSIIDFNQVMTFAKAVCSDTSHPQKMRAFAEEYLDWKVKMNKLKEYILHDFQ